MDEKVFAEVLLSGSHQPPPVVDPRVMAETIVRRDRRRVLVWTILTVFFWIVTVAGAGVTAWHFVDEVLGDVVRDLTWEDRKADDELAKFWPPEREPDAIRDHYWRQVFENLVPLVGTLLSFTLASLFSVLLILSSRRATLRQINASLWGISEQLKQMQGEKSPSRA